MFIWHFNWETFLWNAILFSSTCFTDTLKEILREIDNKLSEEDLDGIIEEVDEDGSGTLDFDGDYSTYQKIFTNVYFLSFRVHGNDERLNLKFSFIRYILTYSDHDQSYIDYLSSIHFYEFDEFTLDCRLSQIIIQFCICSVFNYD